MHLLYYIYICTHKDGEKRKGVISKLLGQNNRGNEDEVVTLPCAALLTRRPQPLP